LYFSFNYHLEQEKNKSETFDSNAEVLIPGDKAVDPTSNPLVMVNEAAVKMSKRKEKDLQKYIGKKLKKDERSSLLERLQKATVNRDSLQSSRSLGQGLKEKSRPVREKDDNEDYEAYQS